MADPHFRYPGIRPFSQSDANIFHGRRNEVNKLFDLLSLRRFIVMYSPSGMGKSSLVNAGLIPKYEREFTGGQIIPVRVRFGAQSIESPNTEEDFLLRKMIDELKPLKAPLAVTALPFSTEEEENSLWYQVKLFERNGKILLFIIDQSEEIFTYFNQQIDFLKKAMYCLFSSSIPKHYDAGISSALKEKAVISNEMEKINTDLKFIYEPLQTQILFVIREDKLGLLNVFCDYFPDILKNIYKLSALSTEGARDAIIRPAEQEGNFDTPKFSYADEAVTKLLTSLKEANEGYDPFSVQLNCRYIERSVITPSKTIVKDSDIPAEGKVERDFVESVWTKVAKVAGKEIHTVKNAIQEKLIDLDHEKRVSVNDGAWLRDNVRSILLDEGMIKKDTRGGLDYFELSHDRLVKPLIDDYKDARERVRRKRIRDFIILVFILLLGLSIKLFYNVSEQSSEIASVKMDKDSIEAENLNLLKNVSELQSDSGSLSSNDKKLKKILAEKGQTLFKIDIFYISENYEKEITNGGKLQMEYAEIIADALEYKLKKETNLVVRKRMLQAIKSETSPFRADRNEIRYETVESEEALKLQQLINSGFSKDKLNVIRQPIKSKSPNYMSIFIQNSIPVANRPRGVALE